MPDDDVAGDTEFIRHTKHALALGMTPDEIVRVQTDTGCHAVYNLQTDGGWYIANGITVHNCRCVARPAKLGLAQGGTMTAATDESQAVDQAVDDADYESEPVPWHGVLAPEGVVSGDKRRFSANALTWRDLPLPLSWQKVADEKHKGA